MASSPRIFTETFTSRRQTPELRRDALSLFIVPPRAQASRRCETQATLSGKAAKLCYRFGPLTPSARSGNLIAGDGTKNGLSRSEQRTVSKTQKQPLDRKSPIQVSCEPDFLDPGADRALCDRPQELLFVGSDARWSRRSVNLLPLKNVVIIICRPRVLRAGANRGVCGSQRGGVWRRVRDRRLAGPYHS